MASHSIVPALSPLETASPTTVLVTGATGYIAAVLVKRLLAAGHTVHGTVRDVAKATEDLSVLEGAKERLKLFKADLLSPDGFKEAAQGATIVFHTASPVSLMAKDAQKELVEPALQGTANVLNAINEVPTVKRVVFTSSVFSVAHSAFSTPSNYVFTDADWNTESSLTDQPYSYSKTLAERKAWEIAGQQKRWDLVTVNPGLVWGPPAIARMAASGSLSLLVQVLRNELAFVAAPLGFTFVDVRDVAAAHARAAFTPTANGRYIAAPWPCLWPEAATSASKLFPGKIGRPLLVMPRWLGLLIGPLVGLSRDIVRGTFFARTLFDSSKVEKDLGVEFLPLEQTITDTAARLKELGIPVSV